MNAGSGGGEIDGRVGTRRYLPVARDAAGVAGTRNVPGTYRVAKFGSWSFQDLVEGEEMEFVQVVGDVR